MWQNRRLSTPVEECLARLARRRHRHWVPDPVDGQALREIGIHGRVHRRINGRVGGIGGHHVEVTAHREFCSGVDPEAEGVEIARRCPDLHVEGHTVPGQKGAVVALEAGGCQSRRGRTADRERAIENRRLVAARCRHRHEISGPVDGQQPCEIGIRRGIHGRVHRWINGRVGGNLGHGQEPICVNPAQILF